MQRKDVRKVLCECCPRETNVTGAREYEVLTSACCFDALLLVVPRAITLWQVFAPAGLYVFEGNLTLPPGITLRGSYVPLHTLMFLSSRTLLPILAYSLFSLSGMYLGTEYQCRVRYLRSLSRMRMGANYQL